MRTVAVTEGTGVPWYRSIRKLERAECNLQRGYVQPSQTSAVVACDTSDAPPGIKTRFTEYREGEQNNGYIQHSQNLTACVFHRGPCSLSI